MFILPIRTNIRPWHTPYANYILIVLNAIIFLGEFHLDKTTGHIGFRPWVQQLMLTPHQLHLWQFITYAFLHGSTMHIIGNMFFLYLFGNNVNDKLGNIGYLLFYTAGAIFSGIGHVIAGGGDVLGASGAIAAVTGAYLVFFPQSLITVFYWLIIFIDTFEIHALYFIGFKLIFWDNILERSMSYVAYDAHLSGYLFGMLATLGLLASGLAAGSSFDLWAMIKQWNRRRQYRDVISGGYDPYTSFETKKTIKVKEVKSPAQQLREEKIEQLRREIADRIAQRNLSAAADTYLRLMEIDNEQILPRQNLLDIANQLASENRSSQAAQAYEKFLQHYSNYEYADQVELMLGIIYSRYLDKPDLAKKYLQIAAEKLADPGQLKMCKDELAKLRS